MASDLVDDEGQAPGDGNLETDGKGPSNFQLCDSAWIVAIVAAQGI